MLSLDVFIQQTLVYSRVRTQRAGQHWTPRHIISMLHEHVVFIRLCIGKLTETVVAVVPAASRRMSTGDVSGEMFGGNSDVRTQSTLENNEGLVELVLRWIFLRKHRNIWYLHFLSLLKIMMAQVTKILPQWRQGFVYPAYLIYCTMAADALAHKEPNKCRAITWPNADILSIGPLGTIFGVIEIQTHIILFSYKKMHLELLSARCGHFV